MPAGGTKDPETGNLQITAMQAGYKPSPLSHSGTTRGSPFRRPESPSSPSTLRQATPPGSATKVSSMSTPSRFASSSAAADLSEIRKSLSYTQTNDMSLNSLGSPTLVTSRTQPTSRAAHGNALSQLQPAQVRTLRDSFQILDRDSDGIVNREDIVDMLNQLGLPTGPSDISPYFPPGGPQTMTLAAFLNSLAAGLSLMSPSAELMSAFSAFDDDDSGQVDLAELRDALLHTAPEPGERALSAIEVEKIMAGFNGRRAFSKSMAGGLGKRGEVFKYQEFVNSIVGGNNNSEATSQEGSGSQ
ncbi:EF-hand [Apiospora phragmitis]|uniref:EF-hand n=1 Tax=Apiospora phragmitis TaxID=2905665 RepID=A0ABR1TT80_9PEZI